MDNQNIKLSLSKRQIVFTIIILAIILVTIFYHSAFKSFFTNQPPQDLVEVSGTENIISIEDEIESPKLNPEAVPFINDFLDALLSYYMAENASEFVAQDMSSAEGIQLGIIKNLLAENNYINEGNFVLKKYLNSKSEIISTTAKADTETGEAITIVNNNFLSYLRNVDLTDISTRPERDYQIAQLVTQKKQAWIMMLKSVGLLFPLIVNSASTTNPTGLIPYKISSDDRKNIMDKIQKLFGEELLKEKQMSSKTKMYDPILAGVNYLITLVKPDTYEEYNTYNKK